MPCFADAYVPRILADVDGHNISTLTMDSGCILPMQLPYQSFPFDCQFNLPNVKRILSFGPLNKKQGIVNKGSQGF
ncbi:hypothetical protein QE152_g15802 [Popillia japonica]|uniref:Uncharacterized protein n=1 Tax=Popillia japonica TaxID=7064 RepID=A0AAW1L626_POPJA